MNSAGRSHVLGRANDRREVRVLHLTSMRLRDAQLRELLDAETPDDAALRRNLADIRRINFLLGWTAFTTRAVVRAARELAHASPDGRPTFSLLDLASGSADIPLAIARWAARSGFTTRIVASDISPQIVTIAVEQASSIPSLAVERQDALALTYPPASFDIALCTLALHHFDPPVAVVLLRNMARVARRVLVFDVERSRLAYLGALALTRVLRMNYMTCHDAPASVRRAYSAPELRALAEEAGLREARVSVEFPFRLALRAEGDETARDGGGA